MSRYVDALRAATLAGIERKLVEEEGVKLVESDAAFLRANAAHLSALDSTGAEYDESQWHAFQDLERAEIDEYLYRITSRKSQNEQFLVANARRTKKQTMRRRLLYKEMRQQMLRNSTQQAGAGSASATASPAASNGVSISSCAAAHCHCRIERTKISVEPAAAGAHSAARAAARGG